MLSEISSQDFSEVGAQAGGKQVYLLERNESSVSAEEREREVNRKSEKERQKYA